MPPGLDDAMEGRDDDGAPPERPRERRRVAEDATLAPGHAYVIMENVYDKLQLLDCAGGFARPRDQRPITRWEFAAPGPNPSVQFALFLELCGWLVERATGDAKAFAVDKFDDPTTATNKLMLALRKLEFGADFPPQQLKRAHGDACVGVLDFLTGKAVARHFVWQRPEYDDAGEEELPVDEDADVGDAIEDDIEACEDDEALFVEAPADEPEVSEERAAQREILKSNVDRVAWKTELERVGPRLRLAQRRAAGKEWRAHVDLTRSSAGVIRSTFPPTRAQLDDLGRAAADASDTLRSKENYINSKFDREKAAYARLREELDALAKRSGASEERVAALSGELAGITDQLDEAKGAMADRGNSMTDTSPLVKIKQALKAIRQECVDFDLQIGVAGHALMQQKLKRGAPTKDEPAAKAAGDFDDSDLDSV